MVTKLTNGRFILPDGIYENVSVYYENGKITAVTDENLPHDCEKNADGNFVSAGFIDIHVHGGGGYEFVDADEESILKACEIHFRHGTTTIFPTISARSTDTITTAAEAVRNVKEKNISSAYIAGIHLEGPYFSPSQCGAQPTEHIRRPEKEEYSAMLREYGDIIKRWSYAPETDDNLEFLHTLTDYNVVASAAHTDALYSDMIKAYNSGMKLITHLYSCTSTVVRKGGFRYGGVIETAYLKDDIAVETIVDGCHLPPELLQLVYKIKGADRMCLVTDSIRYGGLTDCISADDKYIIEDGVAKLTDRSAFAGSIATADVLVRTCVKKAGISIMDSVKMITQTPAAIMNLHKKGKIMYGCDAEFVIFDDDINVIEVIR